MVSVIQSGDDDYLMNGTGRKPTTGIQYPPCWAENDKHRRTFLISTSGFPEGQGQPSRAETTCKTRAC